MKRTVTITQGLLDELFCNNACDCTDLKEFAIQEYKIVGYDDNASAGRIATAQEKIHKLEDACKRK